MRKAAQACFTNRFQIEKTARELLALIAVPGKKADPTDVATHPA